MTWRPLLSGSAAEPVRAAIDDIATALSARSAVDRSVDELAARAVLQAYVRGEEHDWLSDLVDRLTAGGIGVGLYGGAACIGWTLAHVATGDDIDATCGALDAVLLRQLGDATADFDLVRGIVGIGVYALERGDMGRALASEVVRELRRRAERRGGGRAWSTRSESEPRWDLGVAHGVAGAIGFLARASAVEIDGARELLGDAVGYLRGLSLPFAVGGIPPYESAPPARGSLGATAISASRLSCSVPGFS